MNEKNELNYFSQMQNKHEDKDEKKKISNHLLEYGGLFTYPILQS